MSNLIKHAKKEFELAGWTKEPIDEMQQIMMNNMIALLEVFSKQGHSGFSANYAANLFNSLIRYEIITPLTGKDSEWGEPYDGDGTRQNKRYSTVFKRKDGTAYNIDGKVFVTPDAGSYTNGDSRKEVTFPATHKDLESEYVNVKE